MEDSPAPVVQDSLLTKDILGEDWIRENLKKLFPPKSSTPTEPVVKIISRKKRLTITIPKANIKKILDNLQENTEKKNPSLVKSKKSKNSACFSPPTEIVKSKPPSKKRKTKHESTATNYNDVVEELEETTSLELGSNESEPPSKKRKTKHVNTATNYNDVENLKETTSLEIGSNKSKPPKKKTKHESTASATNYNDVEELKEVLEIGSCHDNQTSNICDEILHLEYESNTGPEEMYNGQNWDDLLIFDSEELKSCHDVVPVEKAKSESPIGADDPIAYRPGKTNPSVGGESESKSSNHVYFNNNEDEDLPDVY